MTKRIFAVIVLYRMALMESPTYRSLLDAAREDPSLLDELDLFVADNSPEAQTLPEDFFGTYTHDGANCGLAKRYNQALELATVQGAAWLLTLDQDTTLTPGYLREAIELSASLEGETRVVMIAPKLITTGRVHSPHPPQFHIFRDRITETSSGIIGKGLRAFNSAALLRVSAMNAVGGYPLEYWLDFLDHATVAKLERAGGLVYVMKSSLRHELSSEDPSTYSAVRLSNVLQAQVRYYTEFGRPWERFLYRFDLVRQVIGHGRRGRFAVAKERFKMIFHRMSGLKK